jgi:hypothetical protein
MTKLVAVIVYFTHLKHGMKHDRVANNITMASCSVFLESKLNNLTSLYRFHDCLYDTMDYERLSFDCLW